MRVQHARAYTVTCPTCGQTWESPDLIRPGLQVSECTTCSYLELVHRHAQARHITLKQAVQRFLKGKSRKTGESVDELWNWV